jgi:hypothetical protein
MTGTAFGQQFTPKAGAIYTLTITGDISTDGIMPLRFAYPAVWPVEASWNVTLTQGVPEPSTLMLAALGVLVAMALRRRRAGILVFP